MAASRGRPVMPQLVSLLLLVVALFLLPAASVKHENFKTCAQSGFCTRNRAYADAAASQGSAWASPYALDPKSLSLKGGVLTGLVRKTVDPKELGSPGSTKKETVRLPLTISFLKSGLARITLDEDRRRRGEIELRHDSKVRKERYNELDQWAIAGGLEPNGDAATTSDAGPGVTKVVYGEAGRFEAIITHKPLSIDFLRDGELQLRLNERGLLSVEHWRKKVDKPVSESSSSSSSDAPESSATAESTESAKDDDEDEPAPLVGEDTWWDESFGGNTDSKPRGPESVALDVTFFGYEHVYGIPEHTGPLSLKQTRKENDGDWEDPYRLYNSDVFEYIMDSPMTLYGSIPFMQAHKKDSTVGVFWLNAAETWVDIVKARSTANKLSLGTAGSVDSKVHWFAESGLLDLFVLLGPSPASVSEAYGELTGYTQLPQHFAIAYHQCRWNYVTDEDVRDVDRKFDRHNIPYDIIWLDLEYLDDRRWFTWEPLSFKDPEGMQKQLAASDRKLVVLIDPHIKKQDGYFVHDEIVSKSLAVKNKDGADYEGWCWPGNSHWVDCLNPAAVTWWKGLFSYGRFKSSMANLFIWNDMNEPSVFSGPETTMPKDNVHHGGWEHRDVHNVNGLSFHNATFHGMLERDSPARRPFVLTRSYFAGSQRLGAMWTGDNQASWEHLKASLPMVLAQGISGFPFSGADVGGFFGNPSKELLTRWYQAGAFYPFFRAHAHIDTRRREPYLAGAPYTGIITQAIRLRYSLLPTWYTAFYTASTKGHPIVRPNWWVFPADEAGFGVDDQMYLGDSGLLVKPVTEEGAMSVDVYLADKVAYYDYYDYTIYPGGRRHTLDAPLAKLPLLMQAGHVIVRRDRPRRSSGLMKYDPVTLVVVLDQGAVGPGEPRVVAHGALYLDDGESFEYATAGAFVWRNFTASVDSAGALELWSGDAEASGSGPQPGQPFSPASAGQLGAAVAPKAKAAAKKARDAFLDTLAPVHVERIVVVGAPASWAALDRVGIARDGQAGRQTRSAATDESAELEFHAPRGGRAAWAVVKNPRLAMAGGWRVKFARP